MGTGLGYFIGTNRPGESTPQLSTPKGTTGAVTSSRQEPESSQIDSAPPAVREFVAIYKHLGIKNGDTILDINGVPTPAGFLDLVTAYNSGDLQIHFVRDGKNKVVSFVRDEKGERVSDKEDGS